MTNVLKPSKLSCAVALAVSFGATTPPVALAQESGTGAALEEVIVTATRRSESQQDVAIALQAISEKTLDELRIDSFDDYVANIPGVNSTGQGPGKKEVFIRGVSPGRGSGLRISALGSEPSVATYLDETPTSYAGRNIDLYATDLNRIEVLKGPQGTLFGASSQGGTLRLIPNKPQLEEFEAGVTVDFSDTSNGDTNESFEGYVNIPLIEDKLGFRLAAYNANEGGFIDNIPATRTISPNNPALGGTAPTFSAVANNAAVAEDNYNDAEYTGYRASLLYNINDNWSVTAQYVDQTLDSEGIFEFEPEVSSGNDLNAQTFSEDFADDDVEIFSLTVNGRIGNLDLVYNTSFTERTVDAQQDYTGYANVGPFIPYYICSYPGYASCGDPTLFVSSLFDTKRSVNEFRISYDNESKFRFIAGVYVDNQQVVEQGDFTYPAAILQGFQPNFPIPSAFASNQNARDPGVTFFNDFRTDREEFSVFGEISYDITDDVTLTFGARDYEIDIALTGSSNFAQRIPGPEAAAGANVTEVLAGQSPATISDTIFKVNLSWDVSEDVLLYATFSEGFRSGGFNRNGGTVSATSGLAIPFFYDTDEVDSYELGFKTELLNNTLRLNGAAYYVEFTDLQQPVLDFSISNLTFLDNVGDAEITGLEFEFNWLPTENLTIFGSLAYIDSELVELPPTVVNISPVGTELPYAPELGGTLGLRYEQTFNGNYEGFIQGVVRYTDDRINTLVVAEQNPVEGYTDANASIGVSKDKWKASLYIDNVFNEVGQLDAGAPDDTFRVIPIRPRTIGVRVSYDF